MSTTQRFALRSSPRIGSNSYFRRPGYLRYPHGCLSTVGATPTAAVGDTLRRCRDGGEMPSRASPLSILQVASTCRGTFES